MFLGKPPLPNAESSLRAVTGKEENGTGAPLNLKSIWSIGGELNERKLLVHRDKSKPSTRTVIFV